MKTNILNQTGNKIEEISLNKDVFGVTPHNQSIYDAVKLANANLRLANAKTKTRSEVRGGGRKPWKQKGTGRARHGSNRSPIWRGGGKSFGPTGEQNFTLKQNRKEARLALKSALSLKAQNEAIIVIDRIDVESGKTKDLLQVLENLNAKGKTLIVACENTTTLKTLYALSNLKNVALLLADKFEYENENGETAYYYDLGINVYDVLNADTIIFTKDAVTNIEEVLA